MDDRKIEGLLAVIRHGSLNGAAEELNCSQSAVTQMMNSLENEAGFKILERTNRGVALTKAGSEIIPDFEEAYGSLRKLNAHCREIATGTVRPLSIGVVSSVSNILLPEMLREYQKIEPDVKIQVRIEWQKFPGWLADGTVDLVIGDKVLLTDYHTVPLMEDPIVAVIPRSFVDEYGLNTDKGVSREDLCHFLMIRSPFKPLFNPLYPDSTFLDPFEKEMEVDTDENSILLQMVAAGIGVTLLPKLSIRELPPGVRLAELRPEHKRIISMALSPYARKDAKKFGEYVTRWFNKRSGR